MGVAADLKRLSNDEVSRQFKSLVDGYVRDLAKGKAKGIPGRASQPSVRVSKIRRKRGQLLPSDTLFAMRQLIADAGWAQGELKTSDGRFCLRGAIVELVQKGAVHEDDAQIACQALHDEVRMSNGDSRKYNFVYWNNDPKRTLAEILRKLENAGNRLRLANE